MKKTTFLESAVYNPQNYLFNTNYNREFGDKVRSEGANYLKTLGKGKNGPTVTRNMAAIAARSAQPPSPKSHATVSATTKINKKELEIKSKEKYYSAEFLY